MPAEAVGVRPRSHPGRRRNHPILALTRAEEGTLPERQQRCRRPERATAAVCEDKLTGKNSSAAPNSDPPKRVSFAWR